MKTQKGIIYFVTVTTILIIIASWGIAYTSDEPVLNSNTSSKICALGYKNFVL